MTRSSAPSFRPWMGTLLLAATVLLLFGEYLSPTGTHVLSRNGEDLTSQFVWWRQFGFDQLWQGHLLLWDPKIFCGHPFFGGFQSALLYPPNWLFMVMPLALALNFSIALHVFLAGYFTYLWILDRGHHPAAALMAGFAFMFSGAYFLHVVPGHLPNLCTMPWIPLVFLAVDRYRQSARLSSVLLGMFALSMAILAGHVQYTYYAILITGFYALWYLPQAASKFRYLGGLTALYGGVLLLTSAQLVAGWDAVQESTRAQASDLEFLDMSSMIPERLWSWFDPNFFGGLNDYWGGGIYWEGSVFVGMVVLLLALVTWKHVQHPQKRFFGWLFLFLLVLSIGKKTPLFLLFIKYVPLFNSFRGIGKLNIFLTLILVLMAAIGLDKAFQKPELFEKAKKWAWGLAIFTSVNAVIFKAALLFGGQKLFKQFIGHADFMVRNLFIASALWALLGLICAWSVSRPRWRYVLVAAACAELFCFAWFNRPSFDLAQLEQKVSVIDQDQKDRLADDRVFTEVWDYPLGTKSQAVRGEDPTVSYRFQSFLERIPSLWNYYHNFNSPLAPCLQQAVLTRLQFAFYEQDGKLVPQKIDLPHWPRALWVDHYVTAPKEQVLDRVFGKNFDLRHEVCLESTPAVEPAPGPAGPVTVEDIDTERVKITATTSHPSLLVLSDNYSRDWKAEDLQHPGRFYPIQPANSFEMAIPLPAGEHELLLVYQPRGLAAAEGVMALSWVFFLGLVLWARRQRL